MHGRPLETKRETEIDWLGKTKKKGGGGEKEKTDDQREKRGEKKIKAELSAPAELATQLVIALLTTVISSPVGRGPGDDLWWAARKTVFWEIWRWWLAEGTAVRPIAGILALGDVGPPERAGTACHARDDWSRSRIMQASHVLSLWWAV